MLKKQIIMLQFYIRNRKPLKVFDESRVTLGQNEKTRQDNF